MPVGGLATEPGERRIVLRHVGGYVGTVINGRYLRMNCRDRRCRHGGGTAVHVWDLLTGRLCPDDDPIETPATATQGVDGHGR